MILLTHKSEQVNVYRDHMKLAQRAFPKAKKVVWDGKPPNLKGEVVLKVGNSYYLGTDQFDALGEALGKAAQIYTIVNDYTSPPPTQVRDAIRGKDVVALTTVPKLAQKTAGRRMWDWFKATAYVDWNRASWPEARMAFGRGTKELADPLPGLVYWGALRPARVLSFKKYLSAPLYPVHLSGALRSRAAWEELCPKATWHGRIKDLDQVVKLAGTTVYIEDECQHGEYHSVASRFYEAIGRGLLVLVDQAALATFAEANIDVRRWAVRGAADVKQFIGDRKVHWRAQQRELVRDYAADAVRQLKRAVSDHG